MVVDDTKEVTIEKAYDDKQKEIEAILGNTSNREGKKAAVKYFGLKNQNKLTTEFMNEQRNKAAEEVTKASQELAKANGEVANASKFAYKIR